MGDQLINELLIQDTRKIVREATGRELEEIFEDFDPNPIASGSVGQVNIVIIIIIIIIYYYINTCHRSCHLLSVSVNIEKPTNLK